MNSSCKKIVFTQNDTQSKPVKCIEPTIFIKRILDRDTRIDNEQQ